MTLVYGKFDKTYQEFKVLVFLFRLGCFDFHYQFSYVRRFLEIEYRRIHHVKFLAFHGNQLEYNGSQGTNGAS